MRRRWGKKESFNDVVDRTAMLSIVIELEVTDIWEWDIAALSVNAL